MKFLSIVAILASVATMTHAVKLDLLNAKNAPSTGQEWVSVSKEMEAQMADFSEYPPEQAARLRASFQRLLGGDGSAYDANFVGK